MKIVRERERERGEREGGERERWVLTLCCSTKALCVMRKWESSMSQGQKRSLLTDFNLIYMKYF